MKILTKRDFLLHIMDRTDHQVKMREKLFDLLKMNLSNYKEGPVKWYN